MTEAADSATAALLRRWTAAVGGTETAARTALGVSHATWSRYVNHKRPLPRYIERSIEAHLALRKADAAGFDGLLGRREREAARLRGRKRAAPCDTH